MTQVGARICPRCRAEYEPNASECSDCGCGLELAGTQGASELPDASELRCVRIADAFHVQELAEALHQAGIPSRIDTHPPGAAVAPIAARGSRGSALQIGLYVRPSDLEAAHAALTEHDRARMPDSEGWDASDADPNACPGCGTALAPSAESCAECGLEFPAAATCAQCGSLAEAARSHCAVCGAELAG